IQPGTQPVALLGQGSDPAFERVDLPLLQLRGREIGQWVRIGTGQVFLLLLFQPASLFALHVAVSGEVRGLRWRGPGEIGAVRAAAGCVSERARPSCCSFSIRRRAPLSSWRYPWRWEVSGGDAPERSYP